MGFAVFIHRSDSIYDDHPTESYQFPASYRTRAEGCVGDWVVYYEPVKVSGTRGYFAVAKVQQIILDPVASGMYRALIEPGTYLPFANPVPFQDGDGLVERGLLNEMGRISGRAQAAIRPLAAPDFNRIISRGLPEDDVELPRVGDLDPQAGFAESQALFNVIDEVQERARRLASRAVRDRVFRRVVLRAYDSRCVVTGLKLINGGGRAEVEAAHIRPVEMGGPDIVINGLALSGTAHWMFDRGLIGVADDLRILVSGRVNDREGVEALLNPTGHILPPANKRDQPHPQFLQWHRENCFKA